MKKYFGLLLLFCCSAQASITIPLSLPSKTTPSVSAPHQTADSPTTSTDNQLKEAAGTAKERCHYYISQLKTPLPEELKIFYIQEKIAYCHTKAL